MTLSTWLIANVEIVLDLSAVLLVGLSYSVSFC